MSTHTHIQVYNIEKGITREQTSESAPDYSVCRTVSGLPIIWEFPKIGDPNIVP